MTERYKAALASARPAPGGRPLGGGLAYPDRGPGRLPIPQRIRYKTPPSSRVVSAEQGERLRHMDSTPPSRQVNTRPTYRRNVTNA